MYRRVRMFLAVKHLMLATRAFKFHAINKMMCNIQSENANQRIMTPRVEE